jgi:DNA repair protein RadC
MASRLVDARLRLRRLGPELLDDASLLAVALGGGSRGLSGAHRLLAEGGGLRGLGRWTVGELVARHAIAETRAAALVAAGELSRRAAAADWPAEDWVVRVPGDVGDRLLPMMEGLEREELRVLLLNTRNVVQAMVTVYVGNLSGSSVRVAEVFRDAVRALAAGIVVAHNHPSGDPTPSADDLRITRELTDAGRLLDIAVLDHLVIGRGRWVSLRATGAL